MTIAYMTKEETIFGTHMEYGYHYKETIATGATGSDVFIPRLPKGREVGITLFAGANTGKFQATRSLDSDVLAGSATWFDVALTSTTGTVPDTITSPISGLRGVSLAGEISIEVKI